MKKVLSILGGSGFLGKSFYDSFISKKLEKFDIKKLNLISRTAQKKFENNKNIDVETFNFDFSTGIGSLPDYTDYIINAVDHASYDFYDKEYTNDKMIENVISYTKNQNNKPDTLYISSGAVYGSQFSFEGFDESFDKPDFSNFSEQKKKYALSKKKFEGVYETLSKENLKVVIARCFTFIGSNVPLDQHFAIGNFYSSVLKNKKIQIKSKQKIFRSYMNADDLVNWLMVILIKNKLNYDVFNVGSDNKIEIEEIAKLFKDIFEVDFERLNGKSEDKDIYLPNINKAKNTYDLDYEKDLKYLIKHNFDILKK